MLELLSCICLVALYILLYIGDAVRPKRAAARLPTRTMYKLGCMRHTIVMVKPLQSCVLNSDQTE